MEQLGPYQLIERIGSGGMCEVFRARRRGANHDVALKRLHQEMENQPDAVDLFLTEADLGVMLKHPNLVNTVASDEDNGRYYIAMELVDGMDLAKLLRRAAQRGQPLDVPLALHITIQLCTGLHYLHTACGPSGRNFGIVHRDVAPDNIFVTRDGQVKLADLGVAKIGRLESVTTLLGGVKGKLTYMSPEQIRGEDLDARSDMFSAALILYEMLAGEKPYGLRDGENELQQALRVREADILPISDYEPELPVELQQALRQALHKKVKKRFASCEDFSFELENLVVAKDWVRSAGDLAAYYEKLV